ncbi:manganese efflux pump MntP family protein [Patescibacteria group bacterium]|nr:manganese efflux pump MntP family protein [Patescibacteria group bacterium]
MVNLFITALALSMDACAAIISLSSNHRTLGKLVIAAVAFALFQAVMPVFGYLLGIPFSAWISRVDHWVAFIILTGLGANMIFNLKKEHELEEKKGALSLKLILALSVATSIDAFVIGIGFHAFGWNVFSSVLVIGIVTLATSLIGIIIGYFLHKNFSDYAEKIGGTILVILGLKILVSHLFL